MRKPFAFSTFVLVCFFLETAVFSAWNQGPNMLYARMDSPMAVWEGYVYIFGGGGTAMSRSEKISVYGGPQWQECQAYSNLPNSPWRGAKAGNKYYLLSNAVSTLTRKLFIYDFYANTWSVTSLPDSSPMVPDLWAHGMVTLNGFIWVIGGALNEGSGDQRTLFRYDPADNAWMQMANLHRARNFFSSFAINGKIYVAGGSGYSASLDACEFYDPSINIWTEDESQFAFLPATIWGAADAIFNDQLYIIGGVQNELISKNVWIYDMEANQWTAGESIPNNRYRMDAASDDDGIYLAGGSPNNLNPTNTYFIYSPSSNTQTPLPTFTPTVPPTPTPIQSSTPPPPPTHTARPSSTPSTPYFSPSPSPTKNPDCSSSGVDLLMPYSFYSEGLDFYLTAYLCNAGVLLKEIPLFIILEAADEYFFFPNWTSEFAYQRFDLKTGLSEIPIFPLFTWPQVEGAMTGLRFYGAITDFSITQIIGSFDMVEFGFGPPSQSTPTPANTATSPTPTPAPSQPTFTPQPTSGPEMDFTPGVDAGNIPGADCINPLIFCYELTAAGDQSDSETIGTIRNSGVGILHVTLIEETGDWSRFALLTGDLDLSSGASQPILCRFSPDAIDDYSAVLGILGSDGSSFQLTLNGRGIPPL